MTHKIDYNKMNELFDADFKNGLLYHKDSDDIVQASITYNGSTRYRVVVNVEGKKLPIHRILWVMWNKCEVPAGFDIKHINKNQIDNRLKNLSATSRSGSLRDRNNYRETLDVLITKAEQMIGKVLPYSGKEV